MKKIISLFAVFVMLFSCVISANAATTATSEQITVDASVEQEVLDGLLAGQITNEEDVLRVALEQYQERKKEARNNLKSSSSNSFYIEQLLDTHVDDAGNIVQDIFTTNLLVLDENNRIVTPRDAASNSIGLSTYQIYAYMNVNYTVNVSALKVRINNFTTTLTYGTAMRASALIQSSKYADTPFNEIQDVARTYSNPNANVSYLYTPSNTNMINYGNLTCGVAGVSTIKAGTQTASLGFEYDSAGAEWSTSFT
ncbi:hypothetical protein [uncultured Subdoligranulum sp.]|uniref:hypothetical protein n=1 Tax=uncultured Subdoligranulum sp. TaxID=512298 RepID=UPI0025D214D0|nr:hypothetical protein [uncultured Subdoligranulum sp.]